MYRIVNLDKDQSEWSNLVTAKGLEFWLLSWLVSEWVTGAKTWGSTTCKNLTCWAVHSRPGTCSPRPAACRPLLLCSCRSPHCGHKRIATFLVGKATLARISKALKTIAKIFRNNCPFWLWLLLPNWFKIGVYPNLNNSDSNTHGRRLFWFLAVLSSEFLAFSVSSILRSMDSFWFCMKRRRLSVSISMYFISS